ncbi:MULTISPECIES: hypothetical protein [Spirosoma]|uniref:Acid-shock protein n=1 Tax=Spirosoma liriopis TaxID=2937440 RepID=A0ABT0HQA2_9BACT|nr:MULTISPECIES: hypothetical protein [Spirosoma]MCK8494346.1 hypothetical protein [Spirosoma liriopis]UHG89357.1 hypothetical protein LQ777_13995 [Spirosoma oryzicola]
MKTSLLITCILFSVGGNAVLANHPSQDKPVSKTVTTSKQTTAPKKTMVTKTVHKKHVKKSE